MSLALDPLNDIVGICSAIAFALPDGPERDEAILRAIYDCARSFMRENEYRVSLLESIRRAAAIYNVKMVKLSGFSRALVGADVDGFAVIYFNGGASLEVKVR